MNIETVTRGIKRTYEQWLGLEPNGIDKTFFNIVDADTSEAFLLDSFTNSPFGVVYQDKGGQAHVRNYQPGQATQIVPPTAAEATAIDRSLRSISVVGLEPTDPQAMHVRKIMNDTVKDHTSAHNMTKWKQAIDVIFDDTFKARGSEGADLDLDITFGRSSSNALTATVSSAGDIDTAFAAMQAQLLAQGAPLSNLIFFCDSSWLNAFANDGNVRDFIQANGANQLLSMDRMPDRLKNAHGTYVMASYRGPNMLAPVLVVAFQPGMQYVPYKGATAESWITANKGAMFSMDLSMYRVTRGIDVLTENGDVQTVTGDVVFDTFTTPNPIAEFIRSQTRHVFVPANTNHIVTSTGTFS